MKKAIKIVSVVAVVAVLCAVLFACVPTNADKAIANLTKQGYEVSSNDLIAAPIKAVVSGVDKVVVGTKYYAKDNDMEGITLVYFNSQKEAKAAYDTLYTYFMKNAKDDDEEVKRNGKVIYFGTDDAIDAVKKK